MHALSGKPSDIRSINAVVSAMEQRVCLMCWIRFSSILTILTILTFSMIMDREEPVKPYDSYVKPV